MSENNSNVKAYKANGETAEEVLNVNDKIGLNISTQRDARITDSMAAVMAAGRDARVVDSISGLVAIGRDSYYRDSIALAMVTGGAAQLETSKIGLLHTRGPVTLNETQVQMTTEQALAIGAGIGIALALVLKFFQLLKQKP